MSEDKINVLKTHIICIHVTDPAIRHYNETHIHVPPTRLDRNNVPLKHGEYEIKPKHHLANSDAAEPRVDTEGIIEKTVTKLPFSNEHGDLKDQETNSKMFQNESQKIKKRRGRPRLEREISKADIRTVKKAQPVSPTEAEPKSAFEAVNKIRANLDSEEAKLAKAQIRLVDSQGFRLIKTEIEPPLNLMNHEQILQVRDYTITSRQVLNNVYIARIMQCNFHHLYAIAHQFLYKRNALAKV